MKSNEQNKSGQPFVNIKCPKCQRADFVRVQISNYGDFYCTLCGIDFTMFGTKAVKHIQPQQP